MNTKDQIIDKQKELIDELSYNDTSRNKKHIEKLDSELIFLEAQLQSEQITEGELFRKVIIKTAEDLPSEISIKYFVMFKDGTYCKDKRLNPLDRTNMQVWTSFVDWYLQPLI